MISVDLPTGEIVSLIGGSDYRKTQYNRALEAQRQIGSLAKPFVYLTAFEKNSELLPISTIVDEPWSYQYDKQDWQPQNYSKDYQGTIPLFYALKNSINIPAAKLAQKTGFQNIANLMMDLGLSDNIPPLPSISLGATSTTPYAVAQAFSTLARFGQEIPVHLITKVETLQGELVYQAPKTQKQVVSKESAAIVIGMMKQTLRTGTARLAKYLGWRHPSAGKTGTTNNNRDSWFVGFTPKTLTVVWVGNDDGQATQLTGSSGALRLWTHYMTTWHRSYLPKDFHWPETMTTFVLSPQDLQRMTPQAKPHELVPTQLIDRKTQSQHYP